MTETVDIINTISDLLNEDEAATLITPRDADAMGRGPEGVMLSARLHERCPRCDQDVPFVARQVEGYFGPDGRLMVELEWGRMHGCGLWTPVVDIAATLEQAEAEPESIVAELRRLRTEALAELAEERLAALQTEVACVGVDDLDDLPDVDQMTSAGVGIDRATGEVVAWDFRPGGTDETDIIEARAVIAR